MDNASIDYIEKLEALQQVMPSFEDLVLALNGNFVEYNVAPGFAVGHGCLNNLDCAVQELFVSEGSVFPQHNHDEWEYLIVISGEGEVEIDGTKQPFHARDCLVIKPGQVHTWWYRTATKQICITIPASRGFPDAN